MRPVADTQDGPDLYPITRELASGPNDAAISTLLPSGRIQTQDTWVGTEGERLYVDTEPHRQQFEDLERDPRGLSAVPVTGRATAPPRQPRGRPPRGPAAARRRPPSSPAPRR